MLKQKNEKPPEDRPARHEVGPKSIQGVEASDLPDKGRGSVNTNYGKEAGRKPPHRTGGTVGGDVGMRAMPDIAESDDSGGRKKN